MKSSSAIRKQVETALARRIPSALTPQMRSTTVRQETGVAAVDSLTGGGLPMGAVTELVGAEGSGRTTLAMRFVAERMKDGQVCAWVDATDGLDPEVAAAAGMDLERLLWVRCGGSARENLGAAARISGEVHAPGVSIDRLMAVPAPLGGGGSSHPRGEGRGLPEAIGSLMGKGPGEGSKGQRNSAFVPLRRRDRSIGTPGAPNRPVSDRSESTGFPRRSADRVEQVASDRMPSRRNPKSFGNAAPMARWDPRCAESQSLRRGMTDQGAKAVYQAGFVPGREESTKIPGDVADAGMPGPVGVKGVGGPWKGLDHALRAADLLLQGGGFGVVVLDLGSLPPEVVWRVPLATWFRFRAAAERTRASLLLLTQHACARSSAELVLEMAAGEVRAQGRVMIGIEYRAEIARQRFAADSTDRTELTKKTVQLEKVVLMRKPPQPDRRGVWDGQTSWSGRGSRWALPRKKG